MEENQGKPAVSKAMKIARILVPLLIVAAVAGIWLLRNAEKSGSSGSPDAAQGDNPDFALLAQPDIDLDRLKSYGLPVLLDFSAEWCPPCQEMKPILEKLNKELQGKAIIKIVDTDELPAFSADYPVRAIPTQFFFDASGQPFTTDKDLGVELQLYAQRDSGEHVLTAHEGLLYEEQLRVILAELGVELS